MVVRAGVPGAVSMVAVVLLMGVGLSAPAEAQQEVTGPGPGLYTIRPLEDPDRVLTADPMSGAAICEPADDDPGQAVRLRPVRRVYNVLSQNTDQYLGYYSDGRAGWADELAEWEIVSVDGFGEGVYRIRLIGLDWPPRVLTAVGGEDPAQTAVRPEIAVGDPALGTQLWTFERETGYRPFSGELVRSAGS